MMGENALTVKLIKRLNEISGCRARKRHGGKFQSGDPDVAVVYKGHAVYIEVKVLGGALTKLQAFQLARWAEAGATCLLVVFDEKTKLARVLEPDTEGLWMSLAERRVDKIPGFDRISEHRLEGPEWEGIMTSGVGKYRG